MRITLGLRTAFAALLPLAGSTLSAQPSSPAPEAPAEHRYVDYSVPTPAAAEAFARVDPKEAGIDPEALARLVKRAEETHTSALVVLKDGKLVGDWRFGQPAEPLEIMSATKSIVNLAVGRLVYTGKIRSLDEPVATFYPEWKEGPKKAITLRHLLNHTSGLRANPTTEEIYASRDIVKLALDADLAKPPGTDFFYNNKATNLLAGIVEKASGKKLDEYLRDEVFAPLGVRRFAWMRDPSGNPHGMAGLQLDALDLAKLGLLMLDGGTLKGRRILSTEWVRESVSAAQPFNPTCGLLWWGLFERETRRLDDETLEAWRKGGADPAFLERISQLKGRDLDRETFLKELDRLFGDGKGSEAFMIHVRGKGLPGVKILTGPALGFSANGYLGQYLAVLTGPKIVAVRQIRSESFQSEADNFIDFTQRVRELVRP